MLKRMAIMKTILYSILTLIVFALLGGGYLWYSVNRSMEKIYEPLPSVKWVAPDFAHNPEIIPDESSSVPEVPLDIEIPAQQASVIPDAQQHEQSNALTPEAVEKLRHPSLEDNDPFAMLLLGVDERAGDRGRSDTMILLTVQPKKKSTIAISIPRDTRVSMPSLGKEDKINHAYAFGGISLSVETVEQLFGIPIAYYMKTNMEGLVKIVDTIGGVDVVNSRAFVEDHYTFPQGPQHLDGQQALSYSRMRKQDPQGDLGRALRQRQVLSSAIDQIVSVNSITKLPRLLTSLSGSVRTNLTLQNMIVLATKYRPAISDITTLNLQGKDTIIQGIYYYLVKPEERQRIQSEVLETLSST